MSGLLRLLDPLRSRLIVLMLFVLAAPAAGGALVARQAYDEQTRRAETQVHQFASLAAAHERDFFLDTWRLLVGLTTDISLPSAGTRCPRVFTAFLEIYPEYGSLAMVAPDGRQVCSTDLPPSRELISYADAPWFKRLTLLQDFTLSDQVAAPGDGAPALVAAMPMIDAKGDIEGVVAAWIKLDRLERVARDTGLPAEGVIYVLDRQGEVLTRRTGGVAGDGGLPAPEIVTQVVNDEVLEFRADDRDGNERAYSVVVLQGGAIHVLFGLPVASTFGWIDRDLTSRLAMIGVTLLAAALAAAIGGHFLVTRWVRRLRGLAAEFTAGHLDHRVNLSGAPAELRELGDGFATLGRRVATREAELKRNIGERDLLIREIHHRVKNNLQTVLSMLSLHLRKAGAPAARDALSDVEKRVRALALVQRHLYLDDARSLVDVSALLTELARSLAGEAPDVHLTVALPPLAIEQDRATPLALLVTEWIGNALAHAFGPGGGTIRLDGTVAGETVTVTVADDGRGFDPDAASGLGLALVPGLVKQMDAASTLDTAPGRGTAWAVTFRLAPPAAPPLEAGA
ncbi:sensor histidine kinase [Zavarzinia compransoris]|uniref:sensor histidine kinase n=1 Tax=Zavarzinia marina TaxID=2911065 RepID=UPI001F354C7C|nr:sensor histidine kinase [Zavarzinia marina]MCF4165369.1 sensor histidine kinase [Zavarzinia marina]